jgi:hypothetical protein
LFLLKGGHLLLDHTASYRSCDSRKFNKFLEFDVGVGNMDTNRNVIFRLGKRIAAAKGNKKYIKEKIIC